MKNIIYTIAVLTTFLSYGQKKELKQAEKLIDQEFYSEALSILNDNSDFILNADKKFHAQFYSLKGAALKGESRFMESVSFLRKSIELDSRKYSEKNTLMIQQIEADLVNSAVEDNKVDEFTEQWFARLVGKTTFPIIVSPLFDSQASTFGLPM